jgi:hypothetical protein
MVPAGREGECLKIIQVENSSLADLLDVLLGMTKGFDMPAGAVMLMASPSYAATIGTADYAAEFVHASGRLRSAFMGGGGVNVLHGVPFLLGGTTNCAAIRIFAEIEQWVTCPVTVMTTSRQPAKHLWQACALPSTPIYTSTS